MDNIICYLVCGTTEAFVHCEYKMVTTLRRLLTLSTSRKHFHADDPEVLLLSLEPRKMYTNVYQKVLNKMLIPALFITAPIKLETPQCSLTVKWIYKFWYI